MEKLYYFEVTLGFYLGTDDEEIDYRHGSVLGSDILDAAQRLREWYEGEDIDIIDISLTQYDKEIPMEFSSHAE